MSDIRYNSWLHRSGTGGVYQDSSGKVGIGSSVPGNALEIYGTASSVQIEVNGTGRYRGFEIHEGGTRKAYFQHDADGNCALLNTAESDLKFYTGDTQRMQLDGSGRLMIGNTAAANMFSVANNLVVGSGSGSEGMTIYSDSTNDGYIVFADGASDPAYRMGQIIYSHNVNKMQFRTNGNTDRLTIDNAGNTNISGVCTATSFVPTEGQTSHRNLVINGDMRVAQRGTSDTSADYYTTVDRWNYTANMTEEHLTREQESLSSSDSGPYEKGFRKAWKITNGNQTGGADAGGYIIPQYHIEAQDIANSGWHYKSASSYITLSFWVKSSVSQTFYGFFRTLDGTGQAYSFSYSASSTWTKVTKTIPGNSNIDVNNDTGSGLALYLPIFMGTDRTNSNNTENTWAAYVSSNRTKDTVTTWYTTNDATWHITGVQLEVGSVATPFEHRSYAEELRRCMRYYQEIQGSSGTTLSYLRPMGHDTNTIEIIPDFLVPMRAGPTVTFTGTIQCRACAENTTDSTVTLAGSAWEAPSTNITTGHIWCDASSGNPFTPGYSGRMKSGASGSSINFSAEI